MSRLRTGVMGRHLTHDELRLIIEGYESGVPLKKIADDIACGFNWLYKQVERMVEDGQLIRRKPLATGPSQAGILIRAPTDWKSATPAFEDDPRAVAPDYGKAPDRPVIRTTGGVARYG